jgi:ferrous iron transport protein A
MNTSIYENSLTLVQALKGKKYKIQKILGGIGINSHLHAIGIVPDEVISVINKSNGGPITVLVKGVRIALGRGISQKIIINEIFDNNEIANAYNISNKTNKINRTNNDDQTGERL